MLKPTERFEILVRTNHLKPEMMRPLIKVTLYDATSENDFTLLEEKGEYFVSFADRTGTYREFLRMILLDDQELGWKLLDTRHDTLASCVVRFLPKH